MTARNLARGLALSSVAALTFSAFAAPTTASAAAPCDSLDNVVDQISCAASGEWGPKPKQKKVCDVLFCYPADKVQGQPGYADKEPAECFFACWQNDGNAGSNSGGEQHGCFIICW